jgi:hypothetical protein
MIATTATVEAMVHVWICQNQQERNWTITHATATEVSKSHCMMRPTFSQVETGKRCALTSMIALWRTLVVEEAKDTRLIAERALTMF